MDLVLVGITAIATSILSAVAGLGGGVILLAVIAQFFVPVTAIPIHGAVQFVANGSRAVLLRREINWSAVGWSSVLLFPASMLGVLSAKAMPEDLTRLMLAGFVLVVTWRPSLLKWRGTAGIPDRALIGVGALSGFLNSTIGASGPVTSPFFKAVTATHGAFVATAASAQVLAHAAKVTAFVLDGFKIAEHLDIIGVGCVGVVFGSWIGTRLLGKLTDRGLEWIFRTVLTLLALRLIGQAVV